MTRQFIGRKNELDQLQQLITQKKASLVVLTGRRRIGKSRLLQELAKNITCYRFSGIPPAEATTHEDQLQHFGWQLGQALGQPAFHDKDWNDLFLRLAKATENKTCLIILDEISWMGSKDPNFLSKFKDMWDSEFKKNLNLTLVICGSVSSWIENNILSSTGFMGRISMQLYLKPLTLNECNQFWPENLDISNYEKLKLLSVTGGVPRYLEELFPKQSAESNIHRLCFNESGLLFNEFDQIFHDLFEKRSSIYKNIVLQMTNGPLDYLEICEKSGTEKSGTISAYLKDLETAGFLSRDYTWSTKTGKKSKLSRFRISDNYLRFYLKYILPNQDRIKHGAFQDFSLSQLKQWETIMGYQFENLVLNNRHKIWELLNIKPSEVIYDNPYFQRPTSRQKGCHIDYLIQTRFDTLYVIEIKFKKSAITNSVITETQEKIKRLNKPKHVSCRAILIHANEVSESVLDEDYFAEIISFDKLLSHH
jgi:hypothetical protein